MRVCSGSGLRVPEKVQCCATYAAEICGSSASAELWNPLPCLQAKTKQQGGHRTPSGLPQQYWPLRLALLRLSCAAWAWELLG